MQQNHKTLQNSSTKLNNIKPINISKMKMIKPNHIEKHLRQNKPVVLDRALKVTYKYM